MQSTIITKAIREAVKLLDATGVQYAVVDFEGNQFIKGLELRPATPEPTRKKATHRGYGTISKHYQPYVEKLKVGEVAVIPLSQFAKEKEVLRGAIAAWCVQNWGKNSHRTCITATAVEVLRTA
jgi:hypothetical protein